MLMCVVTRSKEKVLSGTFSCINSNTTHHKAEMIYYTYAYLREDKSPYYIGKGKDNRAHRRRHKGINPPKDKSRILILKSNLTEEEAFRHEIYMIAVFGRKDLGTGILHNRTDGGEGASNPSPETIEKRVSNFRGIPRSENIRKKISASHKGKIMSDESRKKMSENNRGETNSQSKWWEITFLNGTTIIKCGLSIWAKENGYNRSSISKVYRGDLKRHKDIVKVVKLK